MAIRVNGSNFESEVFGSEDLVLVDFYSDSCVPCKRLSPVLAELEEQYGGRVKLVKVNVNFDLELAEKYQVQAVPAILFFKKGEELERLNGAQKKDAIAAVIEKLK